MTTAPTPDVLERLAERVEQAATGSRELDALIECEIRRQDAYAVGLNDEQRSHWKPIGTKGEVIDHQGFTRYHPPTYTFSIDVVRSSFPYLVVFASDIGADGLAMVKLVADTGITRIVEYTGIASRLEAAWLAACLRAKAALAQELGR